MEGSAGVVPRSGQRIYAKADQTNPCRLAWQLRVTAGARRTDARARPRGERETGGPAHASGGHPRPVCAPDQKLDTNRLTLMRVRLILAGLMSTGVVVSGQRCS